MKPILFNTMMVKALLDGRKTVTRRLVKEIPNHMHCGKRIMDWDLSHVYTEVFDGKHIHFDVQTDVDDSRGCSAKAPCAVGDVLYVRETFAVGKVDECGDEYQEKLYISQCEGENDIIPKEWAIFNHVNIDEVTWKPSIFMPKEAARIFLKVTGVRVERLQEITPEQVIKEGVEGHESDGLELRDKFEDLWNSTIKKQDLDEYGWDANPWVWVIEFERCEKVEVVL